MLLCLGLGRVLTKTAFVNCLSISGFLGVEGRRWIQIPKETFCSNKHFDLLNLYPTGEYHSVGCQSSHDSVCNYLGIIIACKCLYWK